MTATVLNIGRNNPVPATPIMLRLEPNTQYSLQFSYLQDNDGQYSIVVQSDLENGTDECLNMTLTASQRRFQHNFATGDSYDYYIGIVKNDKEPGVMVMDDIVIDIAK